jgi:GMP synthase (glutamine-hydrolysing)
MNIHWIQHVPFEGLASIEPMLREQGHAIQCTRLYKDEKFPSVSDIDWLIVMGGPMGIYDDDQYEWLSREKKYIEQAVKAEKTVLGICLGAQLIADVLGARVYKNGYREIGWFPIERATDDTLFGSVLPNRIEVFHWHGDTFEIPEGAVRIAESAACANQGFIYEDRVIAFQFHLETTPQSATALIEHCGNELDGSRYVQTAEQILAGSDRFLQINRLMDNILTCLEQKNGK